MYTRVTDRVDISLLRELVSSNIQNSFFFLAIILTSYFWGWLADTQGRRPVMLFSMLVSAIFSVLTSFSPNLASFAVLQFISSVL